MNTTIKRTHQRKDPFARVPKDLLDIPELSWKAKGILAYLLGKPPHWKIRVVDLERRSKEGKSAVRTALLEIRAVGIALLQAVRSDQGTVVEWELLLADAPIYADHPDNVRLRTRLGSPDTNYPHVDYPHLDNPHVDNRTHSKNDVVERMNSSEIRGRRPRLLTKGQKKKKKNRGAAPDPGAHPQSLSRTSGDAASPDGDDSSSIAPVGANRGSAPDPASQDKIPSLGKIFPEALLTPDGEKRGLTLDDHPDVIAGWFLYYWRRYQGKILGRKPVLTQKDHDAFVHWYQEAEPEHLNAYLALAVAGWKCKGKKQANGYIKWQTAAKCSPQLSSFLRNLTKIEGELDWDHFDEERRRCMLQSVVMSE